MKKQNKVTRRWIVFIIAAMTAGLVSLLALLSLPTGKVYAQQPTGSIPTVTGTAAGPFVTVYSNQLFIDVYAGPSMYDYDRIGILASGETAPALAHSLDGDWIEIKYIGVQGGVGWIYAPLVSLSAGSLPKIAAPPTSTPATTPTLNPTYVAAYGVNLEPTHLPTFTPPPSIKIPTFTPNKSSGSKIPFGFVILIIAFIGVLGAVISFLRGNR